MYRLFRVTITVTNAVTIMLQSDNCYTDLLQRQQLKLNCYK